jgi:hypothetical protein
LSQLATGITENDYRRFLQVLLSSLYVFSVQGRPKAIAEMTNTQALELLNDDNGVVQSR